jgi:hypothetical protein
MIQPRDCIFHGCDGRAVRNRGPAKHQHRYTEGPGRGDLAVCSRTAAILRDHGVDRIRREQRLIRALGKRPACQNVVGVWNGERWFDRINTAYEVVMLRGGTERPQFLAAHRQKDMPRLQTQRPHRVPGVGYIDPLIACDRKPRGPVQGQNQSARPTCSLYGVRRDDSCIRVRGIDQYVDVVRSQIGRKTFNPAESTTADRDGLRSGRRGAPGKGHRRSDGSTAGQSERELARLRRTSKNKNVRSHVEH